MKKFINIATAAALTASMLCAPTAMVAYALETASFEVCMPDLCLESGKKTITIPVSFDEDVSFTKMNSSFGYAFTSPSQCKLTIKSVKSEVADVTVTLDENNNVKVSSTTGKDFTLKKGTVLFNITVEIGNLIKNSDGTETWPVGAAFRFSMKDFSMMTADKKESTISVSALSRANSLVQVIPDKKTEGMAVNVGSVTVTTKESVKVPIKFTGNFMSFVAQFKVNGGAEIVGIEPAESSKLSVQVSDKYYKTTWTNDKLEDVAFDNSDALVLTVKLPEDAKDSDKFTVSVAMFDSASADTSKSLYPSTITNGVITYSKSEAPAKGGELSGIKLSTPYVVSKANKLDLNDFELTATVTDKDGSKTSVKISDVASNFKIAEEEKGTLDRTIKLEYTGADYTCKEAVSLSYLRGVMGDITLDGTVDTRDVTSTTKEYMAQSMEEIFLKTNIEKQAASDANLKSLIDKYSIDTITEFAAALGDVDKNGVLDTRDATFQTKYYMASAFEEASWDTILGKK